MEMTDAALRALVEKWRNEAADGWNRANRSPDKIDMLQRHAKELATALASVPASPPLEPDERERLHNIIADCNALIDPEQHPELNARIDAVLTPCDEAGRCVPASPPTREVCKWTEDSDWEDTSWDTDCGQKFTFIDGGPKENGIAFCCYCGKPVTAVPAPAVSPDPEDK